MDFLTRIDPTRPLNRLLKGAGRNAAEGMREELVRAADQIFDEKVAHLTYIINRMITDRISQTQNVVKGIGYDIAKLKDECKSDIEDLLTNVDAKYKDNLQLTFAEINQARAEAILDVRQTIGDIDQSIESRINQLFSELMIFFKSVTEVVDKFTPNEIKTKLIDPTFYRFDRLEKRKDSGQPSSWCIAI
jgi:phenylalanyl-tRNA synthetase alpha subunit